MKYFIRTEKNDGSFEFSKPYETEEKAQEALKRTRKSKRETHNVFLAPDIRVGLRLYRNGEYYQTIVSESTNLFFLHKISKSDEASNPVQKDTLMNRFYDKTFDVIEEYDESVQPKKVESIGEDA